MDFSQRRYYRSNEILMKLTGQWPYYSQRVRFIITIVILFIASTQVIPLVLAIEKNRHDWDFLMECTTAILFCGFVVTKHVFSLCSRKKMLMLLSRIRADWKISTDDRDVDVLHRYAQIGRKMTMVYAGWLAREKRRVQIFLHLVTIHSNLYAAMSWTGGTLYGIEPIIPKIIDVLLKNGTKPGEFPLPLDYHRIDMQKYYFYIVLNSSVCISMAFFISLTYDCQFMTYVQHACGLFALLGRKLERIGNNETDETAYALRRSVIDYKQLVTCIAMHNRAIEFAELIEETYSWCFLTVLGMNMLLISLSGVQIFTQTTDTQESVRFIAANLIGVAHLYIDGYLAQRLIDHSVDIQDRIFNGKWYTLRLENQKLLLFMMMRCNTPCQITAGKMAVMSVETFAVILKTSVSYFTLLRST